MEENTLPESDFLKKVCKKIDIIKQQPNLANKTAYLSEIFSTQYFLPEFESNSISLRKYLLKDQIYRLRLKSGKGKWLYSITVLIVAWYTVTLLIKSIINQPTDAGYLSLNYSILIILYNSLILVSIAFVSFRTPKIVLFQAESCWQNLSINKDLYLMHQIEKGYKRARLLLIAELISASMVIPLFLINAHLLKRDALSIFIELLQHLMSISCSLIYWSLIYQIIMSCVYIHSSLDYLIHKMTLHLDTIQFDASMVRHYRIIHFRIFDLIDIFNQYWNLFLLIYYLFEILLITTLLYNLIYLSINTMTSLQTINYIIYNGISIISVTWHVTTINTKAFSVYNIVYRLTLGGKSDFFKLDVSTITHPIIDLIRITFLKTIITSCRLNYFSIESLYVMLVIMELFRRCYLIELFEFIFNQVSQLVICF